MKGVFMKLLTLLFILGLSTSVFACPSEEAASTETTTTEDSQAEG